MDLREYIRTIPDFPKKGIRFKDITTLCRDRDAFKEAVSLMCDPFRDAEIDAVVGIESRGFIFGAAMALELGSAFVPIRKPGKLPGETFSCSYELEYGSDSIEIHCDGLQPEQRVLLVDDLLATGGTMKAAAELVHKCGAEVVSAVFLIELSFLSGRERLDGMPIHVLISYDKE